MNNNFGKIIYYLFFAFISQNIFALNYSKCNSSGTVDVSSCLNSELSSGVADLSLESGGRYLVSGALVLNSDFVLNGNQATIYVRNSHLGGSVLRLHGNSITVRNLNINGQGYFKSSVESSCIGFTNNITGIFIESHTHNIKILNNRINNLGYGVSALSESNNASNLITITDNSFNNIGHTAIYIVNSKAVLINRNKITNVVGNLVCAFKPNETPSIQRSIFADAIYIAGTHNAIIDSNYINNINRIGIVLEGMFYNKPLDKSVYNDNIIIKNNKIYNVHGSRGTENNAGIWVEPSANKNSPDQYFSNHISIVSNYIDNLGAESGAHIQYGIYAGANYNYIESNIIRNFNNTNLGGFLNIVNHDPKSSGGIYCVNGNTVLLNNTVFNSNIGILFNPHAYISSYEIFNNKLESILLYPYYPHLDSNAKAIIMN